MYSVDVLIQGYPGKAVFHGGLGWSTVTLLRGEGRKILVDAGAFGVRRELRTQLASHGVTPDDITDVVLTHAHYDHAVNFILFPRARIWIGDAELRWAASQPPGFDPLPELYVRELAGSDRVSRIAGGDEFLPGIIAIDAPGHTPGHLLYYIAETPRPLLFTGDAAKNRAELLSHDVDSTLNKSQSQSSLRAIWSWWRKKPETLLIPGHDLVMCLDGDGRPAYIGERRAAIHAWFEESILETTNLSLCTPAVFGPAYREKT